MNKLNKYIVTCVGYTSRIEFCFKRKLEIYEENDCALVEKLLIIFAYKNRDRDKAATMNYHSEGILHILKIALDDWEGCGEVPDDMSIGSPEELQGVSEDSMNKLRKSYWWKEEELEGKVNDYKNVPDGEEITRASRMRVIKGNLEIH